MLLIHQIIKYHSKPELLHEHSLRYKDPAHSQTYHFLAVNVLRETALLEPNQVHHEKSATENLLQNRTLLFLVHPFPGNAFRRYIRGGVRSNGYVLGLVILRQLLPL